MAVNRSVQTLRFKDPGFEDGMSERSLALLSARCAIPMTPRHDGFHAATRDVPFVLSGADVAYNSGRCGEDDLPDMRFWPISGEELSGFAQACAERDAVDGWFAQASCERQSGDGGGNLCVAVALEPGKPLGFMVAHRTVYAGGKPGNPDLSYDFDLERLYLLPEARGARLSSAFVALSTVVIRHEMEHLSAAVTPKRGRASLAARIRGEGDSIGGAKVLASLASEADDVIDQIACEYPRISYDYESDIDTVILDSMPDDEPASAPAAFG